MTRGPEFSTTRHRTETVSVTLRRVNERSIAVSDGQEKWVFLPRFYVEVEGVSDMRDSTALQALIGKEIEVTASEKLLIEKGLL